MRYAIISDIHGNAVALEAVLDSIRSQQIDTVFCLGDVVGYGPEPAACVETLIKRRIPTVAGNHDFAITKKMDYSSFNALAQHSVEWTQNALDSTSLEYLIELPLVLEADGFTLVHGTRHTPALFDYVQTCYDAHLSMAAMEQELCFIGHSHVPIAFVEDESVRYQLGPRFELQPGARTIVNVGSVGQPRDSDPRACFAVYDDEARTVVLNRVRYDVERVIQQVQTAGLPRQLGERLRFGR